MNSSPRTLQVRRLLPGIWSAVSTRENNSANTAFTATLYAKAVSLNGLSSLRTKQAQFTAAVLKSAIHRKLQPCTKPLSESLRRFRSATNNTQPTISQQKTHTLQPTMLICINRSYRCTFGCFRVSKSKIRAENIGPPPHPTPPLWCQQILVVADKCSLCRVCMVPLNQSRVVPGLYPAATSELSVYPSHNKAHSAEDILIRSAERLVLIWHGGWDLRERKEESKRFGKGEDRAPKWEVTPQ